MSSDQSIVITIDEGKAKAIGVAAAVLFVVIIVTLHATSTSDVKNMITRRAEIRGAVEAAASMSSDRCLAELLRTHHPGGAHHPGSAWFYVDDQGNALDLDTFSFPLKGAHEIDPAHVQWKDAVEALVSRATSSAFVDDMWEKPSSNKDSMRAEIPNITFVTRRKVNAKSAVMGYIWYAPEKQVA